MACSDISRYIPTQLYSFISSERCCQQYCGSFRSTERDIFTELAEGLGFIIKKYVQNGIETVKVFKRNCAHYMAAENFVIQRQSAKEMYILFHYHLKNEFIGRLREMQVSPDYHSPSLNSRPKLIPVRFSQCAFSQTMAKLNSTNYNNYYTQTPLHAYKEAVLKSVENNRLLVINGSIQFKKSIMVPKFLLENCANRYVHCKIICIELSPVLAAHNCETLSKDMGEKIGDRIAYQLHGLSLISVNSNIIYTSVTFFLRYLMGKDSIESLFHVSHIVVNDVHVGNPYIDLILSEIRNAMQCHPELRVILLSNSRDNSMFSKYFCRGEELQLNSTVNLVGSQSKLPQIFYIEEIRQVISEKCPKSFVKTIIPSVVCKSDCNNNNLDRSLEDYEQTGENSVFEAFLDLVRDESAYLNYRHSKSGCTMLIIAAKLGKPGHIRELLHFHADPFITDDKNESALHKAIASNHAECIELLDACHKMTKEAYMDDEPAFFDIALVSDLICLIATYPAWAEGNILIFVPNYEQLARLNFSILRLKVMGKLAQQVSIRALHEDILKDDISELLECTSHGANIIIATGFGEFLPHLKGIKYVIDCARTVCQEYNATADCIDLKFKWISQESMDNRSLMISNQGNGGICFRLIPRSMYSKLPSGNEPDMLTVPLDRICLTVKLLSPHTMVAEYLQRTISKPPFINVHRTVENLKKLEVFNSLEDITWLGCRLIDLPIECHLGKLLVFGILLRCFDPVLTIASFLAHKDPLSLPKVTDYANKYHLNTIRRKVKEERKRLAEKYFSDHFIYLRIYQEWQNGFSQESLDTPLTVEYDFVMKAIIEKISLTRSNLVVAMRAAQLIHNQGPLNMYSINKNSSNWTLIKAALVGGLYPKICMVDASVSRIKSRRHKDLVLHPGSILRDLTAESFNISARRFSSPWMAYSNESNSITNNIVEICTFITPVTIIMLAGPSKISSENVTTLRPREQGPEEGTPPSDALLAHFYVDEWIWFQMDATDAQLLLKTRQLFYSIYNFYLQNCVCGEKMRNSNLLVKQLSRLLECLAKVFLNEDQAFGYTQPPNIGERPRAKPASFLYTQNLIFGSCKNIYKLLRFDFLPKLMEKQYYIVFCPDNVDTNYGKPTLDWLQSSVSKIIAPQVYPNVLTYIVIYHRNLEQFRSVFLAHLEMEKCKLKECFRNNIPVFELLKICLTHKINLPTFNERLSTFRIESPIGEILLDLFAYRYICANKP